MKFDRNKISFSWFDIDQLEMVKKYIENNLMWAYEKFNEPLVKWLSTMILEIDKLIKKIIQGKG